MGPSAAASAAADADEVRGGLPVLVGSCAAAAHAAHRRRSGHPKCTDEGVAGRRICMAERRWDGAREGDRAANFTHTKRTQGQRTSRTPSERKAPPHRRCSGTGAAKGAYVCIAPRPPPLFPGLQRHDPSMWCHRPCMPLALPLALPLPLHLRRGRGADELAERPPRRLRPGRRRRLLPVAGGDLAGWGAGGGGRGTGRGGGSTGRGGA